MKNLPKVLIIIGLVSIVLGIIVKIFALDFTDMFSLYPFKPQSFLNFANSVFLLSIAISVMKE